MKHIKVIILFVWSVVGAVSAHAALEDELRQYMLDSSYRIVLPGVDLENLVTVKDGNVTLNERPIGSQSSFICTGKATLIGTTVTSNMSCPDGRVYRQTINFRDVEDFDAFTAPVFSTLWNDTYNMHFSKFTSQCARPGSAAGGGGGGLVCSEIAAISGSVVEIIQKQGPYFVRLFLEGKEKEKENKKAITFAYATGQLKLPFKIKKTRKLLTGGGSTTITFADRITKGESIESGVLAIGSQSLISKIVNASMSSFKKELRKNEENFLIKKVEEKYISLLRDQFSKATAEQEKEELELQLAGAERNLEKLKGITAFSTLAHLEEIKEAADQQGRQVKEKIKQEMDSQGDMYRFLFNSLMPAPHGASIT